MTPKCTAIQRKGTNLDSTNIEDFRPVELGILERRVCEESRWEVLDIEASVETNGIQQMAKSRPNVASKRTEFAKCTFVSSFE